MPIPSGQLFDMHNTCQNSPFWWRLKTDRWAITMPRNLKGLNYFAQFLCVWMSAYVCVMRLSKQYGCFTELKWVPTMYHQSAFKVLWNSHKYRCILHTFHTIYNIVVVCPRLSSTVESRAIVMLVQNSRTGTASTSFATVSLQGLNKMALTAYLHKLGR